MKACVWVGTGPGDEGFNGSFKLMVEPLF